MTVVKTLTYTSGYSDNIIDEVDSLITNIAPTDTPFISSIGKCTVETTSPDWLEDTLEAAGANAHVEGADLDAAGLTPAARLTNNTQIMKKAFFISGTLASSKMHGRKDELAYQTDKTTKALSRDVEYNVLNSTKAAGNSTTARVMDGATKWYHANNFYDFSATPAATNHLTETIIMDTLQAMWILGANPDTMLCPPAQKRKISAFTQGGRLEFRGDQTDKTVSMMVKVLETDFGTVACIPERHLATSGSGTLYDQVLIYEKKMFELGTLTGRELKREILAKTGDGENYHLVTEKTLKCRTKKAVGLIANLTQVKNTF